MIVLLQLMIAHFIGDFILQPNSWVQWKEAKKLGAWQLYLHALVHGALAWLLVYEASFWKWAIVIAIIHYIIDGVKLLFQSNHTKRSWFFIDQGLHLVSLVAVWIWYAAPVILYKEIFSENVWLTITLVLFLCNPCSYATKIFISKWSPFTGQNLLTFQLIHTRLVFCLWLLSDRRTGKQI